MVGSRIFTSSMKATGAALGICALVWALPLKAEEVRTNRPNVFVITDQEGYGTFECLEKKSACGKIIADSFCESKGFKLSAEFRKAARDEVTGSIASERNPPPRDPQAFIIACK
jgi:histidyl-tRNA synthetase